MPYRYLRLFLATNIFWGFSFLAIKDLTNASTPVYFLLSVRFLLGATTLAALRWLTKAPKLSLFEMYCGICVGTALFFAFCAQTWGMTTTSPAKCAMLSGTYVVLVPLIQGTLVGRFHFRSLFDAFLCFVGFCIFFEVYRDFGAFNVGDLLALTNGALLAIHFVLTDRCAAKIDANNFAFTQLTIVALWSAIFYFLFDRGKVDATTALDPRYFGELVFLGVVASGLAYWTQVLVQKRFNASVVSSVSGLEGIFSVVFSILFGFEKLTLGIVLGTVVVGVATYRAAFAPNSIKTVVGDASVVAPK